MSEEDKILNDAMETETNLVSPSWFSSLIVGLGKYVLVPVLLAAILIASVIYVTDRILEWRHDLEMLPLAEPYVREGYLNDVSSVDPPNSSGIIGYWVVVVKAENCRFTAMIPSNPDVVEMHTWYIASPDDEHDRTQRGMLHYSDEAQQLCDELLDDVFIGAEPTTPLY